MQCKFIDQLSESHKINFDEQLLEKYLSSKSLFYCMVQNSPSLIKFDEQLLEK